MGVVVHLHFGTKDDLLKELCSDIFDHVFSHDLIKEATHDFSRTVSAGCADAYSVSSQG